jgi:hypothetical protein
VAYLKPVVPLQKRAWTVRDWGDEVSVSRATVNRLLKTGYPRSVLVGTKRLIITPPIEFLCSREDETPPDRSAPGD